MNYKVFLKTCFIYGGLLLFVQKMLYAQDSLNLFNTILNPDRIRYEKPDESFILKEDSITYFSSLYNSTITYIILPVNYEKVLNEFKSNKYIALVDTNSFYINDKWGFNLIEERSAPSNSVFENYYTLSTLLPYKINATILFIGAYPKSTDKLLRKKFLNSALSIISEKK